MKKQLAIIIVLCLFAAGASVLAAQEGAGQNGEDGLVIDDRDFNNPDQIQGDRVAVTENWSYQVETTNAGTRSEGKIGHLFYRGREVSGYFDIIIIDGTKYEFLQRNEMWEFGGYAEADSDISEPEEKGRPLQDQALDRGWYRASFENRRPETPADWVWVKRGKHQARIDPGKMQAWIKEASIDSRSPVNWGRPLPANN